MKERQTEKAAAKTTGREKEMNMQELQRMVADAGYRVCTAACWEDDEQIYAFSVETCPGTHGHPMYEINYSKRTGKLWISGDVRKTKAA